MNLTRVGELKTACVDLFLAPHHGKFAWVVTRRGLIGFNPATGSNENDHDRML